MESVYIDANFIVCWTVKKEPSIRKKVRILLTQLISQKNEMCISTLAFDEAWIGIKREIGQSTGKKNLSHFNPQVFSALQSTTNQVLQFPSIKITQFNSPKKGIGNALTNINKFQLKPRDAFHLAIMKDNKITKLITNDKHFISQQNDMGIQVMTV